MSTPAPRIGDAERESAVQALGEHYAAGRLDKEEFDQRADTAWHARTAGDLAPLFLDLPLPHGSGARQATPTPGRPAVPQRTRRPSRGRLPVIPLLFLLFLFVAITPAPGWLFFVALGLLWCFGSMTGGHGSRRG